MFHYHIHLYACLKPGFASPTSYVVVLFVLNGLRWERDGCSCS